MEKKRQSDAEMQEAEHRVDQAEGQRDPGVVKTKVSGTPDQAECDREKIEQDLERKTGSRK